LAQRRPTGFPGKKNNLSLPSVPASPPVPLHSVIPSVPTTPIEARAPGPLPIAKLVSLVHQVSPSPSLSPDDQDKAPEFEYETSGLDPDLISPPGPLPESEQPAQEPGAPGLNWAWGWPKHAASGSIGRIDSVSLNFPPTAASANSAAARITNQTSPKAMQKQSVPTSLPVSKASTQQKLARKPSGHILPPPRAGWYFFIGRAANPQFLQQLLGLDQTPILQPSVVWGHKRRYHPEGGNVAVEAGVTSCVHGDAWYVPKIEMASLLREWWGGSEGQPGVCGEGFVEVGVEIELEEGRGRRIRRWEGQGSDDDEDGKGCVPGRMFIWRGVDGVLTDQDGDLDDDDENKSDVSVNELVDSYSR
jgi:hypothetical protein